MYGKTARIISDSARRMAIAHKPAERTDDDRVPNEKSDRYGKVADYLDSRAKRSYGEGHDMSLHGEGKPYGEK